MSWTTPTIRATGDLVTASIWNAEIVNNLKTLGPVVTGIIPAAGTTPTAGSGFTYTHGSVGLYVFTFGTPYLATPTINLTAVASGESLIAAQSTTGFTVNMIDPSTGTNIDRGFNFETRPTV